MNQDVNKSASHTAAVALFVGAGVKLYDDIKDWHLMSAAQELQSMWMWLLKAGLVGGFALVSVQSQFVALLLSVISGSCFLVNQVDNAFWRVLAAIPPTVLLGYHVGYGRNLWKLLSPATTAGRLKWLTVGVAMAGIGLESRLFPEEHSARKSKFRLGAAVLLLVLLQFIRHTQLDCVSPFLYAAMGYFVMGEVVPILMDRR